MKKVLLSRLEDQTNPLVCAVQKERKKSFKSGKAHVSSTMCPSFNLLEKDHGKSYELERQGTCSLKVGYSVPDGGELTPGCDMEALDQVFRLLEEAFDYPTSKLQGFLHFESGPNKGRCLQIDDVGHRQDNDSGVSQSVSTATLVTVDGKANEFHYDRFHPKGY